MRFFEKAKVCVVCVGIVCVSLVGATTASVEDTGRLLYVRANVVGSNEGSNWEHAYTNLQEALGVAVAGDEIWVTAGTYTPGNPGERTATFQLQSGVEIYGGFAGTEVTLSQRDPVKNQTILSGDLLDNDPEDIRPEDLLRESSRSDNCYHVVTGSGADETARLDGFVITGGNAIGAGHADGGGMINVAEEEPAGGGRSRDGASGPVPARPRLVNCTFLNNSAASRGGGMFNEMGSPSLVGCVFSDNHAGGVPPVDGGGGLYNLGGSMTVRACRFVGNTTTSGGAGLYNRLASPIILDTVFDRNAVAAIATTNTGGGILNLWSDATIADCTFTGNSASHGGGVENWLTPASTFVNCLFIKNRAALPGNGDGGGLQSWGGGCTPHVINCTFVENTASDLSGGLGASDESGGAGAIVSNCIFWGNRARSDAVAQLGSGATVITYSCVQGGWPGEGNIDVDPLFADPENGDYRLKSQAGRWNPLSGNWTQDDVTSPCIDAGDAMSPIGPEPFPSGGLINMGAYGGTVTASKTYFGSPASETVVAGDINGDGEVDHFDLEIMALHWTGNQPLELP